MQKFHRLYIHRTVTKKQQDVLGIQTRALGPWDIHQIANMFRIPLQICFIAKGAFLK